MSRFSRLTLASRRLRRRLERAVKTQYSWTQAKLNQITRSKRRRLRRVLKPAFAVLNILALAAQPLTFGLAGLALAIPNRVIADDAQQMCAVAVDAALIMDRSGSMADGASPSNCEWYQLDWVGQSQQCVIHSETGLTPEQCSAKPAPTQCGNHPSPPVFTPATNAKIVDAKTAAKSFVDNLGPQDQSALVSFSDAASLDKALSNDHAATKTAIDALVTAGATNIGDAIGAATTDLDGNANPAANKVMILLTDGKANKPNGDGNNENAQDVAYAEQKAQEAAAAGYLVFTIGLGADSDVNETMLQNIANTGGGTYHHAPNGNDLAQIYQDISQEVCQFGSISGFKYDDLNNNGVIDQGEPSLAGWDIVLSGDASASAETDQNGHYAFTGLAAGNYTVSEDANVDQLPFTKTLPVGSYSIALAAGENREQVNFANYRPFCGNAIVDQNQGEQCDDGNLNNGDGCSSLCLIEAPPVPLPGPGEIVINEIMYDPAVVSDTFGEWFEVYNPTAEDRQLQGCVLSEVGTNNHVVANSLIVPPLGYKVLGRANAAQIGGTNVDYVYSNFVLANTAPGDEVILTCNNAEVDRVEYDGGPNFPDPTGASIILSNPALDNNAGANWCVSTSPFGGGDKGTPGALNDSCAPPPSGGFEGVKFEDLSANGVKDVGDPGLTGWQMVLYNGQGGQVGTANTNGAGAYDFSALADGTYKVCEVLQNGWTQSFPVTDTPGSASCTGLGEAPFGWTLSIAAGQTSPEQSFDFGNFRPATLTINKIASPDDGEFTFNLTGPTQASDATTGSGTVVFENLLPGSGYGVSETLPEGWQGQTQIACTLGDQPINNTSFGLLSGSAALCVFNNTQFGTITVIKNTVPDDPQDFSFVTTGAGLTDFTLDDDDDLTFTNTQLFSGLVPGPYAITENEAPGYKLTGLACNAGTVDLPGRAFSVELTAGQNVICTFENTRTASIAGLKWQDFNANGLRDEGEPGLSDWTINLDGVSSASAQTDEQGNYEFLDLVPGQYNVCEALEDGWVQSAPEEGFDCGGAFGYSVELAAGETVVERDFGNYQNAGLEGYKFDDVNGNGVWDDDEIGLEGWQIYLDLNENGSFDEGEPFTETDGDGFYSFTDLNPGAYQVGEVMPEEGVWVQTLPGGGFYSLTLVSGDALTDQDFGNFQGAKISGSKFEDANYNGVWDEGEPSLAGWEITAAQDSVSKSATTDENGYYQFTFLASETGEWLVSETLQPGWTQTFPVELGDYTIAVGSGTNSEDNNFGNYKYPVITGFKWHDVDGNGQRDADDGLLENWAVALSRPGEPGQEGDPIPIELVALSLTSVNGGFNLPVTAAGNYRIFEEQKSGWQNTYPVAPEHPPFDFSHTEILAGRTLYPDSFFDVFVDFHQLPSGSVISTAGQTAIEFGNFDFLIITSEHSEQVAETSATIQWLTSKPATSRVIYDTVSHPALGSAPNYGYANSTPEIDLDPKVTSHNVTITGLTSGTIYYYRAVSAASPEAVGDEHSFSTSSPAPSGGGAISADILSGSRPAGSTPPPSGGEGGLPPAGSTPPSGPPAGEAGEGGPVAPTGGEVIPTGGGAPTGGEEELAPPTGGEGEEAAPPEEPEEEVTPPAPAEEEAAPALAAAGLLGIPWPWWLAILLLLLLLLLLFWRRRREEDRE